VNDQIKVSKVPSLSCILEESPGIVYGGSDLQAVADDGWVTACLINLLLRHPSNPHGIESVEDPLERLSLVKYGFPRQAGLKGIEQEEFKPFPIFMNGHAPFFIVVSPHQCVIAQPGAARFVIERHQHSSFRIPCGRLKDWVHTLSNSGRNLAIPLTSWSAPVISAFTMNASDGASCSHRSPWFSAGTKPKRG
jgi:hypothetical protein